MAELLDIAPECARTLLTTDPNLKYGYNNDSTNHKDAQGKTLSDSAITSFVFAVVFVILLVAFLVCFFQLGRRPSFYAILAGAMVAFVIALGTGIDAAVQVHNDPMRIIYAVSRIVTARTRTPPVMQFTTKRERALKTYLEEHTQQITHEIKRLRAEQGAAFRLTRDTFGKVNAAIGDDVHKTDNDETGWRIFTVSVGDAILPSAKRLVPALVSLQREFKDIVTSVVVSVLPPHTQIKPHVGYAKSVKRCMLGIDIPRDADNCFLCVNGTKQTWANGKVMFFDDTYVHAVRNDTDEERVVVYMDVQRETGVKWLDGLTRWLTRKISGSSVIRAEIAKTEALVVNDKTVT